jgi:hypothetical protein
MQHSALDFEIYQQIFSHLFDQQDFTAFQNYIKILPYFLYDTDKLLNLFKNGLRENE